MTQSVTIPTQEKPARDTVPVIGLDIDVVGLDSAVERVIGLVDKESAGYVCVSTVHMVMEAHDDPSFAVRVNGADMTVADGMPLMWMQRHLGYGDAERVRGNDLMTALLERCADAGHSVGFYGGKPEVIEKIRERVAVELPDLRIVYMYSPPFRQLSDSENSAIIDELNAATPSILFVGLGCPKQENWMAAHRNRVKCVMIGVGAAFDFYAGELRECPRWLSRIGLEWLFRFTQEPKRLWRRYLILNPRFMWLAAKQVLTAKN